MANYDLTYEGSRVQNILDTGDELRDAGYIFRGEATPSTVPGTPTERVAYIGGPGTYTNFGSSTVVPSGSIGVFKYTGSAWSIQVIDVQGASEGIFDLSAYNAQGGTIATYADLSAALTALNALPAAYKKGGMSFKFVLSSDNKYAQFRLITDNWSNNISNWLQTVSYDDVCSHVFTNSVVANKLIKELYLYKEDGTPINDTLYIANIVKNTQIGDFNYYFTIKNATQNVAVWQVSSVDAEVLQISLNPINESGIYGKAIIDLSRIQDGHYPLDTLILDNAYNALYSPALTLAEVIPVVTQQIGNNTQSINLLKDDTNRQVFINNSIANSLIKELYLYKKDGTPITEPLILTKIYKNLLIVPAGPYKYSIVIGDGTQNVSTWLAESISADIIEVKLEERNNSGIIGKAILDFSKIADGYYETNTSINQCALDIKCSPYLYSSSEILKTNQKAVAEESKVNHHIYTDNALSNGLIKELYLYKQDGTPINDTLYVNRIDKNIETGGYFYYFVITNGSVNVAVWSAISILSDVIEVTIVERNSSGIYGKAVLDFSKIEDGTYDNLASVINKCAYDLKCSPYLYAEKQSSALSSQVELNTTDIEHIGDEVFFEETRDIPNVTIVKDKYIYPNGVTIHDLAGFEYAIMPLSYNVKSVSVTGRHFRAGASLVFKDANDNIVGDIITVNDTIYNTITATKPVNAVKAMTCYRNQGDYDRPILFQALYKVGIKEYVDRIGMDGLELPNVSLIPIFGQSLSVGAAATPPISTTCKYKAGIMFNGGVIAPQKEVSYFTDFIPLVELNNETVASGCVEQLIELLQKEKGINVDSAYWDNHKFLFVSCGAGSKTIAMLMSDYYQGLINAVQGAKNIADSKGWKIDVPAVIYIQGETDQKYTNNTDYATYKAALQSFRSTFDTDVKSITSQAEDVKVILYQTCSQNIVTSVPHPTYTNTAMDVPTAQMSLVKEDANFCACNPAYMLDHSTVETIHLSAVGEKLMGLYCGMSLKKIITKDALFKGVTPNTYLISGNSITIKYNVPNPPLRFDVNFVKEVANMGYAVIDSNDTDILTSVSIFDDEVTLVCSASPLNCKLYYGFNGVSGRDGRIDGSRGNVCDNGNVINNGNVANKQYGMPNYAYSFAKLLSSENGNI